MVKKIFTFLLLGLFSLPLSMSAQQRAMLFIGNDGKQETVPMLKGETAKDVISRFDKSAKFATPEGTKDSIINFGKNGATNFIAAHQDVMFQLFDPQAGGFVRSFGWRNGTDIGTITKSTIRAWMANPKLKTLPVKALSTSGSGSAGNMGYYKMSTDGDGLKTPFADEATDPNFVGGKGDSLLTRFDPLGTEAAWLPKGWQFDLVSNKWQGFNLLDYGDTMKFDAHQLIGFTKMNDTKIGDIGGAAGDVNMLIAANSADQYPYHSIKFYEGTPTSNYGWQIRDFEWQFYVIVEYTTDRPPVIKSWDRLTTTLKTTPRTVTANITDDNPGGGAAGVKSAELFYSLNGGAEVKVTMTGTEPNYTAEIPGASPGDVIKYYIVATDVQNLVTTSVPTTYSIFKGSKKYLFMWNGRGTPGVIRKNYFMVKDSSSEAAWYDTWDVKSYGTTDIPELLKSYQGVVEANGDGGYADLTAMAGTWLATGTAASPKAWFWSDQDHGFISGFLDTTFADTDPHAKYFGVKALINQDYANAFAADIPFQVDFTGAADPVFGYLADAMTKDTLTMWYNPWYEWGFQNWVDEFTPTASAKVLFKDKKNNTKVIGLRNSAADNSWHTAWLAFDYSSLELLKDTTGGLKGYNWVITDNGNPASKFVLATAPLGVSQNKAFVPGEFSLQQNYPNPFNPSTEINYNVGARSQVTLKVYNVVGQEVATLVNETKDAGTHAVKFNASKLASGIYFYTLQAGNFVQTKKMVLLK